MLAVCEGDFKDLVILALGTGMQASEVLSLDREHTDPKNGGATLLDTKNGDRRTIPLAPEVIMILCNRPPPLREWFPEWKLYLITNAMKTTRKRAALPGVSFHTLRQTCASHAIMAGADLYTLAKLLGHKDIKMVQRYAHLAPDHLRIAANLTASAIFASHAPRVVPHKKNGIA